MVASFWDGKDGSADDSPALDGSVELEASGGLLSLSVAKDVTLFLSPTSLGGLGASVARAIACAAASFAALTLSNISCSEKISSVR